MLLTNATVATMQTGTPYGLVPNGAVSIDGGLIRWVGHEADLPPELRNDDSYDLDGRLLTPALVDCHTHIVFAGDRAGEFEQRLLGASYADIARAGGGIMATVGATRAAGADALLASALARVDALLAEGLALLEVKSGYGLDLDTELTMLRAARALAEQRPLRVRTTFLGAHALPPDYADRHDAYLDEVCIPALRAAVDAGLADAVDGFCETIAFTPEQIARVFDVAKELGVPVKLHAEQLSNCGGARLAARYRALSADHLEYADAADARALAAAGSVAVLLPGAFYTLRETQPPPLDALREHGVAIALATDCNPGSSPLSSLLLTLNMGCTLFRLTPEEALAGLTRNAARALGVADCGEVRAGLRADLAVWEVERPAELCYRIGFNPLYRRIFDGRW